MGISSLPDIDVQSLSYGTPEGFRGQPSLRVILALLSPSQAVHQSKPVLSFRKIPYLLPHLGQVEATSWPG